MLVAELDGVRAEAAKVVRGSHYVCPQCKRDVILKQGRVVIWHFAHKPHAYCIFAKGETIAHLTAKDLVFRAFKPSSPIASRGYISSSAYRPLRSSSFVGTCRMLRRALSRRVMFIAVLPCLLPAGRTRRGPSPHELDTSSNPERMPELSTGGGDIAESTADRCSRRAVARNFRSEYMRGGTCEVAGPAADCAASTTPL